MLKELTQIRRALEYGISYRFGDGDITRMFTDANAALDEIIIEMERTED